MHSRIVLSVIGFSLAAAPIAAAQRSTTLVAAVADEKTGQPLVNADVVVFDVRRVARTDWLGEARIADIPAGRHRVRVRKLGYAAADLDLEFSGDSIGPVFVLQAVATQLDTVRILAQRVEPRLEPFEMRRKQGIGRFLTGSEIEAQANRDFDIVAVTHFPGLQIRTDDEGKRYITSTRSSCGGMSNQHGAPPPRISGGGMHGGSGGGSAGGGGESGGGGFVGSCNNSACPVKVFLDNMPLADDDLNLIQTWDLAGVEYYTGASMPAEYRVSGSSCGVLLLWSRW